MEEVEVTQMASFRHVDEENQRAVALTKAAIECTRRLGMSPAESASALGVHAGVLAAMRKGQRVVDGYNGEAETADALVRVIKRLSALLGGEETKWRSWLRREDPSLGARPLDVILRRHGAETVASYLEHAAQI